MTILTIVLMSYVMIVIDNSIVITGLPKIQNEFHFSATGLSWVSSAYALTFGGFLLLSAKAGDMYGRRKMLTLGLGLFSISSLAIGLSPGAEFLVTARAIQGVGASILAPSTLAILQVTFQPPHKRAKAISYYAAAGGLSASIGLVLGGLVADLLSWRVGFLINVPIGIVLIWAANRFIPETELHIGRLDIPGTVLSSAGMAAIIYGTISSAQVGWHSSITLLALIGGIALLAAFIFIESRISDPLIPLRLFRSWERSGAYAARLLYIGAAMGFFFYSTLFMQGVLDYSPIQAGFAFLPSMLVNFVTALYVPALSSRVKSRNILLVSLISALAGILMLCTLSETSGYIDGLLTPMIFIGFGMGGAMGPLTSSGIGGVEPGDAGAASGVVNAVHQVGGALGISVMVAAAETRGQFLTGQERLAHQVDNAFIAAAVLIATSLIIVLFIMSRHKE
ncbi:MFS transporter [Pantoea sp. At-9b]|uniref:MFS transporter n=1 Tax=Pantoea sp. (strain At-9b) TaxID=592316 RepID=UPI00167F5AAC|nr:MFS transporter [Pantoea sp. At-9b]